MKMPHTLWYLRRGDTVQGPFAARLLSRQLILGRVTEDDQVSTDRIVWKRIADVPELVPALLQADRKDPVARQRLMAALRWEDERNGRDRRAGPSYGARSGDKRRGRERRGLEELKEVNHRAFRATRQGTEAAQWRRSEQEAERRGLWQIGALVVLLALAGVGAYLFVPRNPVTPVPECAAAPRPQVNWSNCRLEGAKLVRAALAGAYMPNVQLTRAQLGGAELRNADAAYANFAMADLRSATMAGANLMGASLRGAVLVNADFSNANLAYADFSNAQIDAAKFENAALAKAIWVDGTVCAQGSVGVCLAAER